MEAGKTKFKVIHAWHKSKLYHATNESETIPFEVEFIKDRIGVLKRVECTKCGFFESYSMTEIKNKIETLFN
jgi:hypothetical protein